MTQKQQYLAAGLKLMPSGRINTYQMARITGRLGSKKDHTWMRDPKRSGKGQHSCCGSKRDYYHKVACPLTMEGPDDLSDLKDI